MSRGGRFGKYGELKRKSRLRAARLAKRKRFRPTEHLPGVRQRTRKRREVKGGKG